MLYRNRKVTGYVSKKLNKMPQKLCFVIMAKKNAHTWKEYQE